jgi:hypothetical protein
MNTNNDKTADGQSANARSRDMKSYLNYFASVGINILIVTLYIKYIWEHDGVIGLAAVYAAAFIISLFVYFFRNKPFQIDAILGCAGILGMLYSVMIKNNWLLFAEMLMTIVIMFSVTYFYFDWKKIDDERAGKQEPNKQSSPTSGDSGLRCRSAAGAFRR